MIKGRMDGLTLLIGALLIGCGSSSANPDAAGISGAGDYASCDSAANGHVAPGDHACTEFTGSSVRSVLSTIMGQCPASMGYAFSTTARCPTNVPGCICTTGSESLLLTEYIYQTDVQDPVKVAQLLCGKAVDSCFGGLTAPTTN